MNVFILATSRKPELLPYTLLVFKTLRIGFPTARVFVTGNALEGFALKSVQDAAAAENCTFVNRSEETIHHKWVEYLIEEADMPFWICDTDMIFYSKVEDWRFETALAGYRIPEFKDDFTVAVTRSRLHTSLLYIDPLKLKKEVENFKAPYPITVFNPPVNLFYPITYPLNGTVYFHDTMSFVYHAIGGTEFTPKQKDAYFHFFFGTFSDLVLPAIDK